MIPAKNIKRLFIITICLLLIPIFGMLISSGWNWTIFDFVVAFVLIFGFGILYEFMASKFTRRSQRIAIGLIILLGFFLVWTELAVGAVSKLATYLIN